MKLIFASRLLLLCLLLVWSSAISNPQNSSKSAHSKSNDDGALLEVGRGSQVSLEPLTTAAPTQLKIVSYNIRWRGGKELQELIKLFREDAEIGGSTVLGLQEVDRGKKRSGNQNNALRIAQELNLHYAWAAPPGPKAGKEEETGVALLSPYELMDVRRIVLPHPGPGKRRRAAIGATIEVGKTRFRIYSVHSETRIATKKKIEQMQAVLDDLAHYPKEMPAIILGDLNTWEPGSGDDTRKLFKSANFHTPFNGDSTFCRRLLLFDLKLKLDWMWLRGFKSHRHGIDQEIDISDHWPLWAVVEPLR
ncbi:MAG TPA: endonuclease/exonuclease/phosphatase family protein [Pyrinomonadaceae bacterium]|jgi:endonuclease/exonuclease/phosphatase family metal-dependent hydrolase